MVRSPLLPAFLVALGLAACAPIALDGASSSDGVGDGGAAPVVGGDSSSAGFADAGGSGSSDAGVAGFRAACGDTRACDPDDGASCTRGAATPDAATSVDVDGGARDAANELAETGSDSASPFDAGSLSSADGGGGAAASNALACVPHARGRAASCEPAGAGREGAPCSSAADCTAGAACVAARCTPTCCARSTACRAGTACLLAATTGAPVPWLPVCAPRRDCAFEEAFGLADLDAGAPCPTGTQCGFAADEGVRACVALGRAREGEACGAEPCAPGLACVGTSPYERCARLCVTASAQGCSQTTRCRAHPALLGTSTIGYCSP